MRRVLPAHSADPTRPDVHLRWEQRAGGRALAASRMWFHRGDCYPMHAHDYPEVVWVERGELLHRCTAGDRRLAPGTVVLVHPECSHSLSADAGSDAVIANVACAAADLQRLQRAWPDAPSWGSPAQPRYVELSGRNWTRLSECLAVAIDGPVSDFERDAFILTLWGLIRRSAEEAESVPSWLRDAVDALAQPHRLALGLAALTEESGRSREHVSRAVRQAYGCTARELLLRLRVEAVARQLRETNQPLRTIAAGLGMRNLGHLARAFARRYGCTPGEYRP